MSKYPKGHEEIFAELDREYEEEQRELAEEYRGEISEMVSKIDRVDILSYIHIIVGDIIKEQGGVC